MREENEILKRNFSFLKNKLTFFPQLLFPRSQLPLKTCGRRATDWVARDKGRPGVFSK